MRRGEFEFMQAISLYHNYSIFNFDLTLDNKKENYKNLNVLVTNRAF